MLAPSLSCYRCSCILCALQHGKGAPLLPFTAAHAAAAPFVEQLPGAGVNRSLGLSDELFALGDQLVLTVRAASGGPPAARAASSTGLSSTQAPVLRPLAPGISYIC